MGGFRWTCLSIKYTRPALFKSHTGNFHLLQKLVHRQGTATYRAAATRAGNYLAKHYALDRAQKKKLKTGTLFGIELMDSVARLCAMNLLLH